MIAQELYAAVAEGSWLTVVQGAAHGTFLDAGFPLNFVFDRLCHSGSASRHVRPPPPPPLPGSSPDTAPMTCIQHLTYLRRLDVLQARGSWC